MFRQHSFYVLKSRFGHLYVSLVCNQGLLICLSFTLFILNRSGSEFDGCQAEQQFSAGSAHLKPGYW